MKRKKKQGRVGRPRSQAYKPRYDLGTPELAMKKARATNGEDPALSTTALDRLFAKGLITGDQRQAGFRYLILRQQMFGKSAAKIGSYTDLMGTFNDLAEERTPEEQQELQEEFCNADDALKDSGTASYHATRAIILDDLERASEAAQRGLTALSRHWGLV